MTDYTKLIERMRTDSAFDFTTLGNEAADAIEALQSECAEHKENAIRNARIAVSIRAERDQLQAKLDAMGKGEAVQFLCDATRFKVRQHEGDEAGRIYGLPSELNGRWVALVAADDDCHLKLAAPKALEPEPLIKFRHGCKWCGKAKCAAGCHGIGGTP